MAAIHPVKQQLHQSCTANVDQRIATLQDILAGINAARESETKSSVGDKYETGRAMLHRQEEQAHRQLLQALEDKQILDRLDPAATDDRVQQGSLVTTDRGSYYLAVGIGKVTVNGKVYFCISAQSPIGRELLNRGVGEEIAFNGIRQRILVVQ